MDRERIARLSMFGTPEEWERCFPAERRVLVGLTMTYRALQQAADMPWYGSYAHRHLM